MARVYECRSRRAELRREGELRVVEALEVVADLVTLGDDVDVGVHRGLARPFVLQQRSQEEYGPAMFAGEPRLAPRSTAVRRLDHHRGPGEARHHGVAL